MELQKVLEALDTALRVKDYELEAYMKQVAELRARIAELEAGKNAD